LGTEDKNRYDRKEMIEGMIKTTIYESNDLDNQGMIGSKIFYSNQTHKQAITSGLHHRGDMVKSKASSLAFSL
jgi:hypothetical protein